MRRWISIGLALALSACSNLPEWMGGGEDEPESKLPGERIAVMTRSNTLTADATLAGLTVSLPDPISNSDWPQEGGNLANAVGHLAFSGEVKEIDKITVGDGAGWSNTTLISSPVVADGKFFAMDARGVITASEAANISKRLWESKAATQEDESELLGGGLAYADGTLYVTTGFGRVLALVATDGKVQWRQSVGVAVRSAPRVANGKLVMVTVDSQLLALNAADGSIAWSHRGINEGAGFLGTVTPPVADGKVIAPYASGQIFGLNAEIGEELWSDTLLLPRRTSATATFSGIDGNPAIAGGVVYAVGQGGMLGANDIVTGRRLWDIELSSGQSPWVVGDFLFVLTSDNQVAAITAVDGRIKWIHALPTYADEAKKKDPLTWSGPVVAGGSVWVVGAHGLLLQLSPQDGQVMKTHSVIEGVYTAPIIINGLMGLMTREATFHVYR